MRRALICQGERQSACSLQPLGTYSTVSGTLLKVRGFKVDKMVMPATDADLFTLHCAWVTLAQNEPYHNSNTTSVYFITVSLIPLQMGIPNKANCVQIFLILGGLPHVIAIQVYRM